MNITLRYKPHDGQLKLHNSIAPYRAALCGRRWGKSLAAVYEIIKRIQNPNIKMAWMSPSYSTSEVGIDALKHVCSEAPDFVKVTGNSPRIAKFCNGVNVPFMSLDRPDFIRGKGFDFIVIDEGELIKDKIYYDIITPTLAQSQNPEVLAISTPRRKGSWFHKTYERGLNKESNPKFESFQFPSSSNPYLSDDYLEEQKHILPYDTYRREYLAEYIENDSEVFKSLMSCVNEGDPTCQHLHRVLGADLAKMNDYCVYTAICKDCGKVVDIDRFNKIDYLTLVKRLTIFQQRNTQEDHKEPPLYIDSTGVGIVVTDMLAESGVMNFIPFVFTNPSKTKIINDLCALLDHKKISISPSYSDLIFEMQTFSVKVSSSGNFIYNAPEGLHDDCVCSLALACQGLVAPSSVKPWIYDPDLEQDKSLEQNKDSILNFILDDYDDNDHF